MMTEPDSLRARLARKPIVLAPGVYDAFTALVAEQAGFGTLYVSGAAIAYTRLGRSDIGLVSMSEVADVVGLIRDRVAAALIVDADTGYGNIKAALDARQSRDTLLIARTDAVGVEGFDKAIARALAYRDAGADVLFVEAPQAQAELERIAPALGGVPVMANMVEGGKTPLLATSELEALGFALVIFPGGIVRALGHMAGEYYASLAAHGTSQPFRNRMLDFTGLNDLIGTPELLAAGKRYDA
jgi:2-methylisocitrate lyase-like PEP mutase family enzyme